MFLPSTHEEVAILCAKPCACGVYNEAKIYKEFRLKKRTNQAISKRLLFSQTKC